MIYRGSHIPIDEHCTVYPVKQITVEADCPRIATQIIIEAILGPRREVTVDVINALLSDLWIEEKDEQFVTQLHPAGGDWSIIMTPSLLELHDSLLRP